MRRKLTLLGIVVVAATSVALLGSSKPADATILFQVRIEPEKGGQVLCALYRHEKNWLTHTTFRGAQTETDKVWATCVFTDVPTGTYAIAALHDEDRDGKMDKFVGLPLEGYAASRDAHFVGIGAPDWEDAIFSHGAIVTVQRARMKY